MNRWIFEPRDEWNSQTRRRQGDKQNDQCVSWDSWARAGWPREAGRRFGSRKFMEKWRGEKMWGEVVSCNLSTSQENRLFKKKKATDQFVKRRPRDRGWPRPEERRRDSRRQFAVTAINILEEGRRRAEAGEIPRSGVRPPPQTRDGEENGVSLSGAASPST